MSTRNKIIFILYFYISYLFKEEILFRFNCFTFDYIK